MLSYKFQRQIRKGNFSKKFSTIFAEYSCGSINNLSRGKVDRSGDRRMPRSPEANARNNSGLLARR